MDGKTNAHYVAPSVPRSRANTRVQRHIEGYAGCRLAATEYNKNDASSHPTASRSWANTQVRRCSWAGAPRQPSTSPVLRDFWWDSRMLAGTSGSVTTAKQARLKAAFTCAPRPRRCANVVIHGSAGNPLWNCRGFMALLVKMRGVLVGSVKSLNLAVSNEPCCTSVYRIDSMF